jgi:hypothetical protein
MAPEQSSTVSSCLVETDFAGLMTNISISGSGIRFLVDNSELDQAMRACQTDCWSATHIQKYWAS